MLELWCPPAVEKDWQMVIKSIVQARVNQLLPKDRVDLFCELENRDNTPDLLTNIFMTEAATALDELIFNQVSCHTLYKLIMRLHA